MFCYLLGLFSRTAQLFMLRKTLRFVDLVVCLGSKDNVRSGSVLLAYTHVVLSFQVSIIRSVNLSRGTMLRTYNLVKTIAVLRTSWNPLKNIRAVINLINQMFIYSARNRSVNLYLEYSTLNLLTSSLSLSTKSKGDRLSSASITAIHAMKVTQKSPNAFL